MVQSVDMEAIRKLSVGERMKLIELIWATLESEAPIQLSAEERLEIERRIEKWRKDPDSGISHEEFKARIRALTRP
jgi:putative addiction module component (TIGR02574 family)